MIAANSASSSSYDVRISALIAGSTPRTVAADLDARAVGQPGVEDGDVGPQRRDPRGGLLRPSPDSPTTSMSPADSSSARRPWRTTSWSSSRKTRMGVVASLMGVCLAPSPSGRWSMISSTCSRPTGSWVIQTTARPVGATAPGPPAARPWRGRGGPSARRGPAPAGRPAATGPRRAAPARRPRRRTHRRRAGCRGRRRDRPARAPDRRPRRAASTSSSVAPGRASRMFSARVVAKTCGSSSTSPTVRRTSSRARRARSTPPSRTDPSTGSTKRSSSAASVLLPEPDGPTTPTRRPVGTRERQVGEGRVAVPARRDAGDLDAGAVGGRNRGAAAPRRPAAARAARRGGPPRPGPGPRRCRRRPRAGRPRPAPAAAARAARRSAPLSVAGGDGGATTTATAATAVPQPARASSRAQAEPAGRSGRCRGPPRRWPRRRGRRRGRRPATSPARRRPGWSRRRGRTGRRGRRRCRRSAAGGAEAGEHVAPSRRRPHRWRRRRRPADGHRGTAPPRPRGPRRAGSPRTGIRTRSSRSTTLSTSSTIEARTSPRRGPSRPGVSGTSASYTSDAALGRAAAARRRGTAAARRSAAPAGPGRRCGPRRSRPAASGRPGWVGGLHDQPARGGGERDAGGRGEAAEHACWQQPARGSGAVRRRRRRRARADRRPVGATRRATAAGAAPGRRRTRVPARSRATWSASATSGRAVGHHHDRTRSRPSSTRVSATTCSVSASRWAVGSSSSTHGRSASTTGPGRAGPARRPRAWCRPRRRRVEAAGQRRGPAPRARPGAAPSHSGVVGGVGAAEAQVVGDACRPRRPGAAGSQATCARQAAPPTGHRRRSASRPVVGASRPASTASRVDLPQPDGPVDAR